MAILRFGNNISAAVWSSIWRTFMESAAMHARDAYKLEAELEALTGDDTDVRLRHRAAILGGIISAVVGLESFINEFFLSAIADGPRGLVGSAIFDAGSRELIATSWNDDFERLPVLEKYQQALELAGRERFNPGTDPYQAANAVVKLRDALVHFKAHWHDDPKGGRTKRRLQSRRVRKSTTAFDVFPDAYVTHACVEWAVAATFEFHSDFRRRMNLRRPSLKGSDLSTR